MSAQTSNRRPSARSQRPRAATVLAAAFLAGAAAAVGVNRSLDVHLAQRQPRVESEPIFVALRSLPQGSPVTVWDVALRDWPKAMLPAAAMRPRDSFDGMVLRHAVREGQPLLSVQLVKAEAAQDRQVADAALVPPAPVSSDSAVPQPDLWAPAELPATSAAAAPGAVAAPSVAETPDGIAASSTIATSQPSPEQPEPTLAEAAPAELPVAAPAVPESVLAEPVVTSPVFVADAASTDVDPVQSTAQPQPTDEPPVTESRAPVARYLVVPERIALEADRSFVPAPQPAPATPAAPEATASTTPSATKAASMPKSRSATATDRTSSNRGRQSQSPRPPRSASSPPAAAPQKVASQPGGLQKAAPWSLRSMLPSLSLGMGAAAPASKPQPSKPQTQTPQTRRP